MTKFLKATLIITGIYCLSSLIAMILISKFNIVAFRYGYLISGFVLLNPLIPLLMIIGFIVDRLKKAWAYILCVFVSFIFWLSDFILLASKF